MMSRITDRLAPLLPGAVLVFVAALYVLPSEPAAADIFYVAVIPAVLACLLRGRGKDWLPGAGTKLAIALVLWSGLTLIWGHDDKHRTAKFALDSVTTACWVAALFAVLPDARWRVTLRSVLIGVGAANAVLSIVLFFVLPQPGPRLTGWGVTTNAILGANAMAVPYLTALWRGLTGAEGRRATSFAAAGVMALFVVLTESRGPLLAGTLATLFLCVWGPWRVRALFGIAALAAAWALLPASLQRHQAAVLVERGSSHRFEIWRETIRLIGERPLFGHGLASNLGVPEATFPHDLYLSVLFYSGLVGFLLFAALLGAAAWRAARLWRTPEFPWGAALFLLLLTAGLTDFGQITKGPGPIWLVFWLPVCLLLSFGRECDGFVARAANRA